jgi:hypothetical protein
MQLSFDIDLSLPETGAARAAAEEMDPAKTEIWLPFVAAYRTMCLDPSPGFRRALADVPQFT